MESNYSELLAFKTTMTDFMVENDDANDELVHLVRTHEKMLKEQIL